LFVVCLFVDDDDDDDDDERSIDRSEANDVDRVYIEDFTRREG
jgi:hypothetical protein